MKRKKRSPNRAHDVPSDPDDKGQFGFSWHVEISHFASGTTQADLTPVHLPVLLVVLLSPLVDQFPLLFTDLDAVSEHMVIKGSEYRVCKLTN